MRSCSQGYVAHVTPSMYTAEQCHHAFGIRPYYFLCLQLEYMYQSLLDGRISQGKVAELRAELQTSGGKKDKMNLQKKITLKKIVANMTMSNNDMVALFSDIIGCMGIQSLEIKKMYERLADNVCTMC